MGFAPLAVRGGDLICVLFGGQMPFIVREKGEYFELVGEAMQAYENGEYQQCDFSFR
jgi:hypothetical protein